MLFVATIVCGCGKKAPPAEPPVKDVPEVRLVKPELRDLKHTVGQPSFIDAYEQTAIYAKLAGFIQKWNVDIGDRVKKDDLLATIYIPEVEEELNLKKAQVVMDRALVDQSLKLVEVAEANLKAALAQVEEAKANVGLSEALVKRWDSEVSRQVTLLAERVIDAQILGESRRQLESSNAARDAALAKVLTAEANRIARQADVDKAKVDVAVSRARLQVSEADEKRMAALFSYTRLTSPFDGIVVNRNANTGDFVLPAIGDPSASPRSADQSATKGTPIYVVARTDLMRVYVDVPEKDANFVVSKVDKKSGDPREVTKAKVNVAAYQIAEIPAEVERSSWALNVKSRTLRAEIDLPNPDLKLLPGMYAYGRVTFARKNVRVLPRSTLVELGNQMCCYTIDKDNKARILPVQTRPGDGDWVEVISKEVDGDWKPFTGDEEVAEGDLTSLMPGKLVKVVK